MKQMTLTRDNIALMRVGVADSYFLRLRGLIGRDIDTLGGLLIKPCNQIHTFHMDYPIDVVYLSREGDVLQLDPAVPKGKMCRPVKGAKSVLELPAGRGEILGLAPGDCLHFQ